MAKPPKHVPVPTKQQLMEFIREQPSHVGKRELARAFNLTGAGKIVLKQLLKELEGEGSVERGRKRHFARPGSLPDMCVVEISATDSDGELLAKPLAWREKGVPLRIYMAAERRANPAMGIGDRVLVKLHQIRDGVYEARTVRRVTAGPAKVMGVYDTLPDGSGRLRPTDRRHRTDYLVAANETGGAEPGELVLAELIGGRQLLGLKPVRIVERLGSMANPRAVSLICIHAHDIPVDFPPEAVDQAKAAVGAPLDQREDLRAVPLVTIDGEDARDFDDAVWAEATPDGGWHILVAIADVAWYVRPGDALDRAAYERGNSVYFPDRVVPMLPEELSNGWCSLKPNEDRPCMAVEMWIDRDGHKHKHRFLRGLMRSAARLTYTQVQAAIDGQTDDLTSPLLDPVIKPLYGAWRALFTARDRRGVLDLNIPERRVIIGADGKVESIQPRPHFDSHRLIEDMMIAANVCAAETLEHLHQPCMYRVHDVPAPDRLDSLRDFLATLNLKLAKGQVLKPEHFNQILTQAADTPQAHLVNEVVLRAQAQANYSPENLGHFGLSLARYAHFTSPIRRYADLLVHRGLIAGMHLGHGALPPDAGTRFVESGEHISSTERRAATAEREAINRYTSAFLADRVGATFPARVNGVTRFGLFVTLEETGADGIVPISSLGDDYFTHDEANHCLVGRRSGKSWSLGQSVEVRLAEANALTGSLVFNLLDHAGAAVGPSRRGRVAPGGFRPRR